MRKLGKILVFGAVVNFLSFVVVSGSLGGDALNGRIEDGDYLLSNRGRLTQVEPWVWHYSRAHAISIFLTHPLGVVGFLLLKETAPEPRLGRARRPTAPGRASRTRPSGWAGRVARREDVAAPK